MELINQFAKIYVFPSNFIRYKENFVIYREIINKKSKKTRVVAYTCNILVGF